MITPRAMSFTIRNCVVQRESRLLRRSFFDSAVRNGSNNQEELTMTSESDGDQRVHGGPKKLLRVAMIGLPNAGKSTLVNKLMHRSVCPTSSKVHTTTHKAEAIYTEKDTQIIFMDTPGLTRRSEIKTYKLLETFKKDPENSISKADVIGILQDITNVYTRHKFDDFFLDYLKNKREDTGLLLILNKVDRLKRKDALLEVTRLLMNKENYPKFNDIFMVSALTGDGIDDLRNYLLDSAKEKDWEYEEGTYTDQPTEKLLEETVRAQLMDILPYEMPYKIVIKVEDFGVREDDSVYAAVTLECPRSNYVTVMLKNRGFKVKCLKHHVEKHLRHALRTPVSVQCTVVCTKGQHT